MTVNTVKTFAQTLRVMSLSKELLEKDDIATKREAYYVSKNWDDARFEEQPESDTVIDDVEAMFEVNREQLGFIPEEKGGDVAGKLVVIDKDQETGKQLKIDCTKFGSGAYSIPISIEHLRFGNQCEVYTRNRNRRDVSKAGKTQLLEEGKLHINLHGRCANQGMQKIYQALVRGEKDSCICFCRWRPLWYQQHI